jgi:hypothetical protein
MRLIVADAYGYGVRSNSDAGASELSPDEWTEIDVRDEITATFGDVTVRYRDTGREVTVPVGTTYRIEYQNPDVIDARSVESSVDELIDALGSHVDGDRVVSVLGAMQASGQIDELKEAYEHKAGVSLESAIRDKLTGDDRRVALARIGAD